MITKTCRISGKEFIIADDDLKFYEKMEVPMPTLCPEERQKRRLAWQNMMNLYYRKCDATGKSIISNYSPDSGFKVFENPFWWSDKFDGKDFQQDFNFSQDFFKQFSQLLKNTPHPNLNTDYLLDQNSDFCNFAGIQKNCYLVFHATSNEDCLFGTGIKKCRNVVDCFNVFESELLYECLDCLNCYDLKFSQNCQNCSESWFLANCIGCSNCFGCANLRQKKYFLFNKYVGKLAFDDYMAKLKSNENSVLMVLQKQFLDFLTKQIHPHFHGRKNENVTGDNISKSKDCHYCFDVQESQDLKFCERIYMKPNTDCYDVDQFGEKMRYCYNCSEIGANAEFIRFSASCRNQILDIDYCFECTGSRNLFGCVGLKKDQYCILNKQYSKEEYFKLREKIIKHMKKTGEWGEFFPIEISPFAYNETVANEYFPLTKEEIIARNWQWKEEKQNFKYDGPKYEIPAKIEDVSDEVLEKILTCEVTGKYYKIQKAELNFYRKMNLPIPRICPDERHKRRMSLRNPRQLFARECNKCKCEIQTTFAPDRPEKVLCEKCYLNEVN